MRLNLSFLTLLLAFLIVLRTSAFTLDLIERTSNKSGLKLSDVYGQPVISRYDVFYEADISVGTPPQLHRVLLDTGSPYFWIPKSGCKNAGGSTGRCKAGGRVYEPEASRTAVQLKKIFFHEYGRGTASGIYFEDVFAFGDARTAASLKFRRPIRFGGATNTRFGDQGILGLSLPKTKEFGSSVFDEMIKQKLVDRPLFSVFLRQCGDVAECAGGGRITFGSIDRENCGASIAKVDVEPNGFLWKFKMDGLSVGNYALHYRSSAIVDTGSSAVHLPLVVIRSIVREVGAEESGALFLLPCSARFVLRFRIGGHELEVQGKELVRKVSRSKCQLLLSPRNEQPWILGAPFLRSFCVVHRWTERRLEFAPVLN
ncbi:Peptidase A1 domain-containing protein [Aphelenchoides fujianensis]|nr:Peptidase A1 domain-containing protein [Aphelenchoides fujianensis]